MDTLASQLQPLFGRKNWQTLWQTYTLVKNWPKIAGGKVANRSEPAYIQKYTLWIHVRDSVWMQHLQTMKPELIMKIQQFMPDLEIKDIRWIVQPTEPMKEKTGAVQNGTKPADPVQEKAFEDISTTVEDDECRTALCNLWRTYNRYK